MCCAVLWCQGTNNDKADVYASAVNPPDQSGEYVTVNDRDWNEVYYASINIATSLTWKHCNQEYDAELLNKAIELMKDNNDDDEKSKYVSFFN